MSNLKLKKMKMFRAEVTGIGEDSWSSNSMEYQTKEEAVNWLKGLASRWYGFDMSRVVTSDTPRGESVDPQDERIIHNFRTK